MVVVFLAVVVGGSGGGGSGVSPLSAAVTRVTADKCGNPAPTH
jgi:hypothetical protein